MELSNTYFTDYQIKGKSVSQIFAELLNDRNKAFSINQKDWQEQYVRSFAQMLDSMPEPRKIVKEILARELEKKGLQPIDPDAVYLNKFGQADKSSDEQYYNHESGSLVWSYKLTDACLMNVLGKYYYDDWDILYSDVSVGLYTEGSAADSWGAHNIVPIMPIEIFNIFYYYPIYKEFNRQVENFWQQYKDRYMHYLEDNFLLSGVVQYKNKMLSENAFSIIRKVYNHQDDIEAKFLKIYGYASTDIMIIRDLKDATGLLILYIPGARFPFIEFLTSSDCRNWIKQHIEDPFLRNSFANHFSIYERQDGLEYSGVDTALKGIAEDTWDIGYIDFDHHTVLSVNLFATVADKTQKRMQADGDVQIKSDSELTRDHVYNFIHGMLSQLYYFEALVPEILIPLNLTLSLTELGLSVDKMVDGDTYEERKYGVGEFVTSFLFLGINMLPFFAEAISYMKQFDLKKIPEYSNEEEVIKTYFNVSAEDVLIDTPAITPEGEDAGKTFLARLADENNELVVFKPLAGNKYIRLNPTTHEEIPGELISKVYSSNLEKMVYVRSGLKGGAPYSPLELDFSAVMSVADLRKKAAVLGKPIGKSYKKIIEKLDHWHTITTFEGKSKSAFELIHLIRKYKIEHPESRRIPAFDSLEEELKGALFTDGMNDLQKNLIKMLDKVGAEATSILYKSVLQEIKGIDIGKTGTLVLFAENNYTTYPFAGFAEELPIQLSFTPYYVIPETSEFSILEHAYYNDSLFQGLGFDNNIDVLKYTIERIKSENLLSEIEEIDNKLYIGYNFEELNQIISTFSCAEETQYSEYPLTFIQMLQELGSIKGQGIPEKGLMHVYSSAKYYQDTVEKRMNTVETAFQISDNYDFSIWDNNFPGNQNYIEFLKNQETTNSAISTAVSTSMGVAFDDSAESLRFITENLETFYEEGIRNIFVRRLNHRLLKRDIALYLRGENMTDRLNAALLTTLEHGHDLYRALIREAKKIKINVIPTGGHDGIISSALDIYESYYANVEQTIREFNLINDSSGKFLIITPPTALRPIAGIHAPFPNIAELTNIPVLKVTENKLLDLSVAIGREKLDVRVPAWTEFVPLDGKVLGWKTYGGKDYLKPNQSTRRDLFIKGRDAHQATELLNEIDVLKDHIADLATASSGSCASVSAKVLQNLRTLGYNTGRGYSLAYWKKRGNDYFPFNHTATSVWLQNEEFVVDATHLQFPHAPEDAEQIIVQRPEDWAEEIASRAEAIRPWLEHGLKGVSVIGYFEPPIYTKPRILKQP